MNFESCGGGELRLVVECRTRLRVGKDGWVDGWFG